MACVRLNNPKTTGLLYHLTDSSSTPDIERGLEFELSKKDLVGAEQASTVITLFSLNICDWHVECLLTMNKEQIFLNLIIFLTFSLQRSIIAQVPVFCVCVFLVKVGDSFTLGYF